MKRKLMMALLCASLTVSLLACGKQETAEETVQTESAEETDTVSDEPEEATDEAAKEPEKEESKEDELPVGNMIKNGDFKSGTDRWNTYKNGGEATLRTNDDEQLEVDVTDVGNLDYSVQLYYDGFRLDTGVTYKFAFDLAVSKPRTVVWRLQINGGDYHAYFTDTIAATEEMQHYEYELTMEEVSDPSPRLCFNLGTYEEDGDLGEHIVTLDNVDLEITDASNRAAEAEEVETPDININQVGYQPGDIKIATFRGDETGDSFEVVDTTTGKSIFTGQINKAEKNVSSRETCATGDFSSVIQPGTYQIKNDACGESYEFKIGDDVYQDLLKDAVRMLYLQRCGEELSEKQAGDFAHPACHMGEAVVYGTDEKKDVTGGWHDAGDYGRYVVSGAKAVADILLAYENYPDVFGDDMDIPESGNGTPDVLDEARYELDWMLKMQDSASGGVYHKVTCANFPSTVMPQEETEQLILSPISTAATGDFAAVMAMAGRIYKDVDAAFADTCLKAAEKALDYMDANADADREGFKNPQEIVTGEYPDTVVKDEYFWALAELYKTTGDKSYEDHLKQFGSVGATGGLGWANVDFYGMYTYLTCEQTDADFAGKLMKKFSFALDNMQEALDADAYGSTIKGAYPWGSNMTIANNGMLYLMMEQLGTKMKQSNGVNLSNAQRQLSYLLGTNANSYCFVTGYGSLSPQHTHHRPSQALGETMKGMLVGGPDSNLEDPYAKATLKGRAAAKCYADNEQSYSCNEVTIYWNSPLIYLLAGIMK